MYSCVRKIFEMNDMPTDNVSDESLFKEIKKVFNEPLTDENYWGLSSNLANLYSQLSFSSEYKPEDVFPKIEVENINKKEAKDVFLRETEMSKVKWTADGSGEGDEYFSCKEKLEQILHKKLDREYEYPDDVSSEEFQKRFNSTRINKQISQAQNMMAQNALVGAYSSALGYYFFIKDNKKKAQTLLNQTYQSFWKKNNNIEGFDYLKNITDYSKQREFLMGVASEIPLADVEAYLKFSFDGVEIPELQENGKRFEEKFKMAAPFFMTNKTWDRYIENNKLKLSQLSKIQEDSGR